MRRPSLLRRGGGIAIALGVGLAVFAVILIGESGSSAGRGNAPAGERREAAADPAEPAVDFAVPLFDGTEFRLGRHLAEDGRPVFLNLWASWCPPCRAEMPHISAAAQRHDDVLFLGVAVSDDRAAAASFAAEIDVAYALGFDSAGMVNAHYPAPGLPATFLISGGGDIVGTFIGQMHPDVIEQLVADLRSE